MEIVTNSGPHGSLEHFPSDSASLVVLDSRIRAADRECLIKAVRSYGGKPGTVWVGSSGTTQSASSLPRLVALSRRAIDVSCAAVNQHLGASCHDVWLSALPDFHVRGLLIQQRASLIGAGYRRTVGNMAPWNAASFHRALVEHGATLSALVPAQLFDLVRAEIVAPRCLRALVVGGQALSSHLYHAARALGWPVLPSFGMTEAASQVATASFSTLEAQAASCGSEGPPLQVLPHMEVKVDVDGLLALRSEALCDGWLVIGADGERCDFVHSRHDGWFVTSDRAEVHGTALKPLGRSSDQVKIGGELVQLMVLEEVLMGVLLDLRVTVDVALDILPDDRLGHVVALKATSSDTIDVIVKSFNQRVQPAARIRSWKVEHEIPRTALGKPRRHQ